MTNQLIGYLAADAGVEMDVNETTSKACILPVVPTVSVRLFLFLRLASCAGEKQSNRLPPRPDKKHGFFAKLLSFWEGEFEVVLQIVASVRAMRPIVHT